MANFFMENSPLKVYPQKLPFPRKNLRQKILPPKKKSVYFPITNTIYKQQANFITYRSFPRFLPPYKLSPKKFYSRKLSPTQNYLRRKFPAPQKIFLAPYTKV